MPLGHVLVEFQESRIPK